MKKKPFFIKIMLAIIVSGCLLPSLAMAQTSPGAVLHLLNNKFNSYFNTGVNLNNLLNQADDKEASVEFWIRSGGAANEWVLTDLLADNESFSMQMADNNQLKLRVKNVEKTIDLTGIVAKDTWHHVALVVNNFRTTVYINGRTRGVFTDLNFSAVQARQLYFYKSNQTELYITELRAWKQARTLQEMERYWAKVIKSNDSDQVAQEVSRGLEVLLNTTDKQLTTTEKLGTIAWQNAVPSSEVKAAKGVAEYRPEGLTLIELTTTEGHPILDLEQIRVTASKGEFTDKVRLGWNHVAKATSYRVSRRTQAGQTFINLPNPPIVDTQSPGDEVAFEDSNLAPGERYVYRIEALGEGNFRSTGTSLGFVFYNGQIAGKVTTNRQDPVENVEIKAELSGGGVPGQALMFAANDPAIVVDNIEALRNQTRLTIEFWYKGTGNNTIFTLGNSQIKFTASKLMVSNADGSAYLEGNLDIQDNNWHHYAFTFTPVLNDDNEPIGALGKLYQDSKEIASSNAALQLPPGSVNNFSIGAQNSSTYLLDEFKVWSVAKSEATIKQTYRHVLSGEEDNLLLYYRFDEGSGKEIYNYALATRNDYIGKSQQEGNDLKWSSNQHADLYYGVLTSASGNYVLKGLNYGTSGTGFTFKVTPQRPNHEFKASSIDVLLQRGQNITKNEVNFTDVSQFTISGRIVYEENGDKFPAAQGQKITLNGMQARGERAETDATGQYVVSASPERIDIKVQAEASRRTNLVNQSLRFDGKNAYAQSEGTITNNGNATWSFWVKPASANEVFEGEVSPKNGQVNTREIPRVQTVFALGNIRLDLEDSQTLVLKQNGNDLVRSTRNIGNQSLSFCVIGYNAATRVFTLYVNDTPDVSAPAPAVDMTGRFTLGGVLVSNSLTTPFRGHIDHIEYRTRIFANNEFKKIQDGEFIADDAEHLQLSYPIVTTGGVRELSLTAHAKNNGLKLENAQRDNKIVATNQGSFKLDYRASNQSFNPQGDTYTLNINGVKSDLDFVGTTRYGFVGNIVIPCDNHIGNLTGRIFRTDIQGFEKSFDASNFNNTKNVFTVGGLIPGQYRVEIRREGASPNTEPLLRSPVLDITQGWTSYDFEYHNPLSISYNIYEVDIISRVANNQAQLGGQRGQKLTPLCSGNYVLDAYKNYELELTVSEQYGSETCNIPDIAYIVSGTAGTWMDKAGENAVASSRGNTDKNGKAVVRFMSAGPSFDAQNFLEQFEIVARTQNRSNTLTGKAFIKGTQQLSSDFTLREPEILHVLHDPPGDESFATLAKGSSIAYAINTTTQAGVEVATTFQAGTGVKVQSGGGFGAIFLTEVARAKNLAGVTTGFENNNTLSTQNLWTLTTDEEYSTSAGGDIVGPDADLFIGAGKIITYGGARKLVIDEANCTASIQSVPQSIMQTFTTPFAFTAQHVKDVTIPGFDKLVTDENTKVANGTQTRAAADVVINDLQRQKTAWQAILDKNYKKIAETAENDKTIEHGFTAGIQTLDYPNRDFAYAGGGQTYTTTLTWAKDNNISNEHEFIGSIGTTIDVDNVIFGVRFKSETEVTGTLGGSLGSDNSSGSSTGVSFTLADGDQGDQFYVLMRRDADYNTPIFLTIGGRSSCPIERNTQPREGVRIESSRNSQDTPIGTKAIYQLRLTNTQISEDATDKAYIVAVDESSNSKGAKILLNGAPLGNGRRFMLSPKASTTAELTIEQNASGDVTYEDIKIRFFSECEFALDNTFSYTPDELYERNDDGTVKTDAKGNPISKVKIVDEVSLNAYFRTPCVTSFDIKSPTENWVVNNTSENKLLLRFKPEQAQDDLNKIEVEYAPEGTNREQLLTTLKVADLTKDSEGFYQTEVNVSALTDGKYQVRLVPVCGTTGSNNNNVSEWIDGVVQQNAPGIVSVSPVDNGTLQSDGVIAATYTNRISNNGINSLNVNVVGVLANTNYTATAAQFVESTDRVEIPDNAALDAESYTVEFWLKAFMPASEVSIIDKGSNFNIRLRPDGKINTGHLVSNQTLTPNQWTHVAVVYDAASKSHQIYFDGRLAGERDLKLVPAPHFTVNNESLIIGKQAFRGSLDEVRVWNKARTSNEVIDNYQKMLLGNETNLVGYYRLDNDALTVNGVQEGIRDFTGNASGTTAIGITWVTNQNAAPLSVEAVAQTIPSTVRLSNENQILVTPNLADSDLEGAFLTVTIANNKIKDLFGNQIAGKSWSFRYNKNLVAWDRRNIDITQVWQQAKDFNLSLMNNGATNVTYSLVDLPEWLTVTSGQQATLNSGSSQQVNFSVKPWLNPGSHTALIKAEVHNTDGRLLGIEQVVLQVQVNCAAPDYRVNAAQYRYSMILRASLHINGQRSIDPNDRITAFVTGSSGSEEVRGQASLRKNGDEYEVLMLIFSNQAQGEALKFRVWDASECREYGSVIENYTFANNSNLSNQTFTVGNALVRRFKVVTGFQFVTFNATDEGQNYLSINQVKGLATGSNIFAQDGSTANFDGSTWTGNLTRLLPTQSYQLQATANATVELQGRAVNLNTTVQIGTGFTNLGYLPDKTFTVNKALASLNVPDRNGLILIGPGGVSEYNTQTGQWSGSVEFMAPNQGFRLQSTSNGTLNYATSLGNQASSRTALSIQAKPMREIRAEAQALGMQVNPLKYRYATHAIGVLTDRSQTINTADYILTAHTKTGEVRGVAIPQMVSGKLMYFLTVHTNSQREAFSVKLTHRITKETQQLDNQLSFDAKVQGNLAAPYKFRMAQKEAGTTLFSGVRLYQNQPNPFHEVTSISYELPKADEVRLAVYNQQGQQVAVLAQGTQSVGKHTVQWQRKGLPAGVYFYTLTTGSARPLTKRLVIY